MDVAITPLSGWTSLQENIPPDIVDIIRRGVKVLVDKDGKLTQYYVSRCQEQVSTKNQPKRNFSMQ